MDKLPPRIICQMLCWVLLGGVAGIVLSSLLDLPASRLTASELLYLAAAPAVRQRFSFTDDDLARLRTWVIDSGIRWGEDAERRARFGLPHVLQGTWRFGLDRLLAGVAVGGEDAYRYLGTALPLDDVESTDVDLAGRLAELADRLGVVLDSFEGRHPVGAWMTRLGDSRMRCRSRPSVTRSRKSPRIGCESWQQHAERRRFPVAFSTR